MPCAFVRKLSATERGQIHCMWDFMGKLKTVQSAGDHVPLRSWVQFADKFEGRCSAMVIPDNSVYDSTFFMSQTDQKEHIQCRLL